MRPRSILPFLPWVLAASIMLSLHFTAANSLLNDYDDSVQYLFLGKSIEQGTGYHTINEPGMPPHTEYPFVFPLLISFVIRIFGFSLPAIKMMTAGFSVGISGLALIWFRRHFPPWTASLGAVFLAVSPYLFIESQKLLSETPYLFFVLASLVALEFRKEKKRWAMVAGLLGAAAALTRKVGLLWGTALLLLIPFLRTRKHRIWAVGSFAVPTLLWFLRDARLGATLKATQIANAPLSSASSVDSAVNFGSQLGTQLAIYGREMANFLCPPAAGFLRDHPYFALIPLALFLVGFIRLTWKRRLDPSVPIYFVLYLGLFLLWPWTSKRFVLPLLPFALFYAMEGVRFCMRSEGVTRGIFALVIVLQIPSNLTLTREIQSGADRFPPFAASYEENLQALVGRIPQNANLCAPNTRLPAFIGEWKVAPCPPSNLEKADLISEFERRGITYVIYDSVYLRYQRGDPKDLTERIPECRELILEKDSFKAYRLTPPCFKSP